MTKLRSAKPPPKDLTDIERLNALYHLSDSPLPDIEELNEAALRYLEAEKAYLGRTS